MRKGSLTPDALRELLDADGTSMVILGLDMSVRSVNVPALQLLGVESIDALQPGAASHAMLRSFLDHAPRQLVSGHADGTWHGDIDHIDAVGERIMLRATVAARRDPALEGGGFVGLTAHDVTSARREAARLRHRASHDPLTGLANRRQILASLAHAIAAQRGQPGHVAAVFVDVDRLKFVNDALGHPVGDRLLVSAAQRLVDSVRPGDRVAQMGGDEFLVVCADLPDPHAALELADRISRALTGRLRVRRLDLNISVSIGVAVADAEVLELDDAAAAESLISNADTAMYEAKSTGRGRCVQFTSDMQSAARERAELSADLARAIHDKQLTIDYQPLFSTVTNSIVGAEALVRWQHPTRGRMDPADFVSIAEESGTIGGLGEFVLERALIETSRWLHHGLVGDHFSVHVNVSSLQLASSSFVSQVVSLLRLHRLAPRRLVLEAREAALLGRNADVDRSVRALRRIGVQIAIDDFGTGINALSVLTDVGADFLKLDGALALPAGSTDTDTRLVRAVVLLAHALNMRVVAERVTDPEQLRRLRFAGCDQVQGNLLAPPARPELLVVMPSS